MSGPAQVRLKRRRSEVAPDTLIVEQSGLKRALTDDAQAQQLRYKRQSVEYNEAAEAKNALAHAAEKAEEAAGKAFSSESIERRQQELKTRAKATAKGAKREYHLSTRVQSSGVEVAKRRRRTKTGQVDGDGIATFEEKRTTKPPGGIKSHGAKDDAGSAKPVSQPQALKRPSKGSAVSSTRDASSATRTAETPEQRARMEAMADSFHQFALDEGTTVSKPKITSLPKFATRRRNINGPTAALPEPRIRDEEMELDDDSDYVYDTYILAASSTADTLEGDAADTLGDIGYLIITDEDQSLWEAYIEDEPSDKEFDTDDEDENAEDYYGADYPEDELASDDEYGRNAYVYRRHGGSDDEEWDEDTGAYSDDEEYERTMNPWKSRVPTQVAKESGDEEDSD